MQKQLLRNHRGRGQREGEKGRKRESERELSASMPSLVF